jgi:hypothetical protein
MPDQVDIWRRTDAERCPICAEVVERIREQLATGAGVGILKTAKALGVGTGTVHRVNREMAAVATELRGVGKKPGPYQSPKSI